MQFVKNDIKCICVGHVRLSDLYSDVVNHCQRLWQADWDRCVLNKLHSVKPFLGYSNLSSLSRQDAVVLRRLRIGHTRLTRSYLLNRQDQPECSHCDCALTVAHVLLECNHYNVVRQRYCKENRRSLRSYRTCGPFFFKLLILPPKFSTLPHLNPTTGG